MYIKERPTRKFVNFKQFKKRKVKYVNEFSLL